MTKEHVRELLSENGFKIIEEYRTGNNLGTVYKLHNGCLVNCWDSGKVNCQGKNTGEVECLLSIGKSDIEKIKSTSTDHVDNKKVFVVYGHDINARTQLEAMLRRWELEPIILDQQISSGKTIIEKLEEHISKVSFAIVLSTPDDVGYPKNDESKKRYRVRQNVVLELGMLLSKLGRDKVAILLSQVEDMESPSDIHGLLYIPFKDNVEDAKLSLAKEMQSNGYSIKLENI